MRGFRNRSVGRARLVFAATAAALGLCGSAYAQQSDMTAIQAKARQEGRLVIYTSSTSPEMQIITKAFAEEYPDIKVNFIRLTSAVAFNRYLAEVTSGVPQVDILYTASTALYDQRPELFMKLTDQSVPNLLRHRTLSALNDSHVISAVTPHTITYSTAAVTPEDLKTHLKEWRQLTDPRWKNQIGFGDPRLSTNALSWVNTMRNAYGDDWVRAFGKNGIKIFESGTTAVQQVIAGAFQVFTPTNYSQSAALVAQKAPVAVVQPAGPVHVQAQALAIPVRAPHPNAALAFIDWELSDKGQATLCLLHQIPVVDTDAPGCAKMPADTIPSNDSLPAKTRQELLELLGLSE
jgi:iron(III) transport system substrate-binding protein